MGFPLVGHQVHIARFVVCGTALHRTTLRIYGIAMRVLQQPQHQDFGFTLLAFHIIRILVLLYV
jgi:hypothetical protein